MELKVPEIFPFNYVVQKCWVSQLDYIRLLKYKS